MAENFDLSAIMASFKNDENMHQKGRQRRNMPLGNMPDEEKPLPVNKLSLDEEAYHNAHRYTDQMDLLDLKPNPKRVIQNPSKVVNQAVGKYREERVTPQILRGMADWLCNEFTFIYIEDLALYVYDEGYFRLFTFSFARRFFVKFFRDYEINYALRTSDYKELVYQLQAQPQIMKRQEECRTNVNIILFSDGVFNVKEQRMQIPRKEDYQFSKIKFPLRWGIWYEPDPEAKDFVQRFCGYDLCKEKYLWELIGYLFSGYQKKILVIIVGPSNSGKSTLANMLRRIFGSDTCVALGIKELSGNFNLAQLQGKRLCIDSEMDVTALNAKDISLLKKVVGNDLIQGNRKYEQQFYFQCQTKFLICSNNRIRLGSDEDTVSFCNRIRIFELEESIPLEEQRYDLEKILDGNRTFFLQEAMKGLCRLVQNNFEFSYSVPVENFVENVNRKGDLESVRDFVSICCEYGDEYHETVADLYNAYRQFAVYNGMTEVSMKKFSCFLNDNCGIERGRTKKSRFFKGIRIVTDDR